MVVKTEKAVEFHIVDDEFEETLIVKESPEFEGLVYLEFDSKSDKKYVSFTADQAEHVGKALISFAEEIRKKYQ